MAKSITFKEFEQFYKEHLEHRSASLLLSSEHRTNEFKNLDIGIDTSTFEIWRIVVDNQFEVNISMQHRGTILDLLIEKLNERLLERNSGAI